MQKNELAKQETSLINFDSEKIDLIKQQIAPKATDAELQLFVHVCKKSGLDPFARQIYAIHRNDNGKSKMTIQTSIDGFRVIAQRSGDYAGQSKPVFVEKDNQIISCEIAVRKFAPNGTIYDAAVAVVYFKEYVQNTPLWSKMPHTMISKCAEAVALRKAFPNDLSGLYTSDEISIEEAEIPSPIEANNVPAQKSVKPVQIATEQVTKTPVLPQITKALFDKLITRVKSGDVEAYYKAKETFVFTVPQLDELNKIATEIQKNKSVVK